MSGRRTSRIEWQRLSSSWRVSDLTPALADADRELLSNTLRSRRQAIGDRGAAEQLLHGEPHPGNVLSTKNGLLFIDLETCCRGPVEFDLAHVPEDVVEHYPDVDEELLSECRLLVLAMVAAWRWDPDDQFPDGHTSRRGNSLSARTRGPAVARARRRGPPVREFLALRGKSPCPAPRQTACMRTSPLLQSVDAVTVPVPDLDAGLDFYRDVLGSELRWRNDALGQAGLGVGRGETELVLTTEHAYEPNWLVESVDEAAAVFRDSGGSILVEPFDIPVGRIVVVADPFGNVLVLIDLSKGRYTTDDEGAVTGVSPAD